MFRKIFNFFKKKEKVQSQFMFTNKNIDYNKYQVGEFTYGTPKVLDWGEGATLVIGKFCSIADDVTIFLGGNHRTDWVSTYPFNVLNDEFPNAKEIKGHPISKGDVIIGNDVWIGKGASILSGVLIGDGAVIGAETVVTKDVEPYSICVGNPGKVIKKRFSDYEIELLLKIKWWDWSTKKINEEIEFLCGNISCLEKLNKNEK